MGSTAVDYSKFGTISDSMPQPGGEPAEKPGAAQRFVQPAMDVGRALFKGVDSKNPLSFDSLKAFGGNVVEAVKNLPQAQQRERDAMHTSWNEGDHMSAVAHGISALVPVLGPMAQDAATKWINGDHAGAVGTFALMAVPEAGDAGSVAGAGARTVAEAGARSIPAIVGEHPGIVQTVGGAGGAALGHMTGIPGAGVVGGMAGKMGAKALSELVKEVHARGEEAPKATPAAPPPAETPYSRVANAFDPATARPAPPTTAPGNAVYEHGPVDMPQPAAAAPGAAPVRGNPQPIDTTNVGPRADYGEGQLPARPGSGLVPRETGEELATEPPHPIYDKLARDPELMGKFRELRDMLSDKGHLEEEPGAGHEAFLDQNTNGLQVGPEVSNRSAVVKKLADHFEKGGMTHEDVLSRAEHPFADQVMWKNAVAMSKASKQKGYSPSAATKEAVIDELKRRAGSSETGPR